MRHSPRSSNPPIFGVAHRELREARARPRPSAPARARDAASARSGALWKHTPALAPPAGADAGREHAYDALSHRPTARSTLGALQPSREHEHGAREHVAGRSWSWRTSAKRAACAKEVPLARARSNSASRSPSRRRAARLVAASKPARSSSPAGQSRGAGSAQTPRQNGRPGGDRGRGGERGALRWRAFLLDASTFPYWGGARRRQTELSRCCMCVWAALPHRHRRVVDVCSHFSLWLIVFIAANLTFCWRASLVS